MELLTGSQGPGPRGGEIIIYHRRGGGLLEHSSVGKPFLAVGRLRITGLVHILLLGLAPGILILFVGSST
jgi:hypothetical protein